MDQELISKKELLETFGISYGALYLSLIHISPCVQFLLSVAHPAAPGKKNRRTQRRPPQDMPEDILDVYKRQP